MANKSINKVILVGNMTRDPELKELNSGTSVCNFSLAINDSYKNQSGEIVDSVVYIDCEAWSGLADVISKYTQKGSRIYVEGKIKSDSWVDADTGKSKVKLKVRVSEILLLDSRQTTGSSNSESRKSNNTEKDDSDPLADADSIDDLPF